MSKNEMLKLASKHYEMLPEVRKKRQEQDKKEDLKKRMAHVKEYEKKRRESQALKLKAKAN